MESVPVVRMMANMVEGLEGMWMNDGENASGLAALVPHEFVLERDETSAIPVQLAAVSSGSIRASLPSLVE